MDLLKIEVDILLEIAEKCRNNIIFIILHLSCKNLRYIVETVTHDVTNYFVLARLFKLY